MKKKEFKKHTHALCEWFAARNLDEIEASCIMLAVSEAIVIARERRKNLVAQ